jgi:3-dehydroquinate synthase
MGVGYDVLHQNNGLVQLGGFLLERDFKGQVLVVADTNVTPLYAPRVVESLREAGLKTHLLGIPVGERNKTLETISSLWRGFLETGLDRKSTVIALGGGVTGDLSGFSASTFMRGIPWVGLPTSVLAMVDSSLGGKTGCDLPEGKNLIGTFHSPRLVISDPSTLVTLPEEELRSGLSEVVKHGVIADPVLFEICTLGYEAVKARLSEVISRAMAVKIMVIENDPLDRGPRAALNFGHTVGHAIETVSGYRLRHGEAIAIGMVYEARLAERLHVAEPGLSGIISDTLRALGLSVELPPDLKCRDILRAIWYDKKKVLGALRLTLPTAIGKVLEGVEVSDFDMIMSGELE